MLLFIIWTTALVVTAILLNYSKTFRNGTARRLIGSVSDDLGDLPDIELPTGVQHIRMLRCQRGDGAHLVLEVRTITHGAMRLSYVELNAQIASIIARAAQGTAKSHAES